MRLGADRRTLQTGSEGGDEDALYDTSSYGSNARKARHDRAVCGRHCMWSMNAPTQDEPGTQLSALTLMRQLRAAARRR